MPLQLLSVAPEIFPLVKTGGLADVAGALPAALAAQNVRVTTLVPGYRQVLDALGDGEVVGEYPALMGGPAVIRRGSAAELDLFVLDAPHLYVRDGNPYVAPDGRDWPDNPVRFAALARVAADIAQGRIGGWQPDIVQTHDWQAALAAAYLHFDPPGKRPPVVMTIHNLAFQGIFPAYLLDTLGLPADAYAIDGMEYHGSISFLKAGLVYADHVSTVSPTYAREILTRENGMGLDGVLATRAGHVSGILNGIDTRVWDPATDPLIAAQYSATNPDGREANKRALQAAFGLPQTPEPFLLGSVGRLTEQKGIDILIDALPTLLKMGGQFVLLGSGDPAFEDACRAMSTAYPDRIACRIGYDETIAHLIQAGSDALIVPSRFEPCGLTQLCALRYGAVPIVARVGGLADTVIDANPAALSARVATGLQFAAGSTPALIEALHRAGTLYADQRQWANIRQNGLASDVSWEQAASQYAALFHNLIRTQVLA
ncbi:starch synthase [Sphingomonas zeicaulis]|uniref:glycogen synthase GlgA n=1 Tax=Sphingomonas zeicaulis TaxID=1632740 RepID=UPI003D20189E